LLSSQRFASAAAAATAFGSKSRILIDGRPPKAARWVVNPPYRSGSKEVVDEDWGSIWVVGGVVLPKGVRRTEGTGGGGDGGGKRSLEEMAPEMICSLGLNKEAI